jgi:cytochrome c oxidase subunit 7c
MMLINASRAATRITRAPLQARSVHIENHVGAVRSLYVNRSGMASSELIDNKLLQNMPFKYTDVRKSSIGLKVAVFMISGFSIPFVAAWYQR